MRSAIAIIAHILIYSYILLTNFSLAQTILPLEYPSKIIVKEEGIYVGERDHRVWKNPEPYNGVYFKANNASYWQQIGPKNRSIEDMVIEDNNIYVATYYTVNGLQGIFKSSNNGQTWEQMGPNVSTSILQVSQDIIAVGTNAHGMWLSVDQGENWTQIVGAGFFGPKIKTLYLKGDVLVVGTKDKTYIYNVSTQTLNQLETFNHKTLKSALIIDDTILLAFQQEGIYKSNITNLDWEFINDQMWPFIQKEAFNSVFGLQKIGHQYFLYEIFNNHTNFITHNTPPEFLGHNLYDIEFLYPNKVLISVDFIGVYALELQQEVIEQPIFDMPFDTKGISPISYISSYFDHQYPLLGYNYYSEPTDKARSTVNFYGQGHEEPTLYYSSHNGIDFALPYKTPIFAVADGVATYSYCKDCGNTINIDHNNGFRSIYMHLHNEQLYTTSVAKTIKKGQLLGLVGMTGRTSGPHLHFGVQRTDKNFPDSYVDPFGWLPITYKLDPWSNFIWEDTLGVHAGSQSLYLWNIPKTGLIKAQSIEPDQSYQIQLENISIVVLPETFSATTNINMYPFKNLTDIEQVIDSIYFPHTSVHIDAYNNLSQKAQLLKNVLEISIKLGDDYLADFISDSLQIYRWDEITNKWIALESNLDLATGVITASTDHLSTFAVYGKKHFTTAPTTYIYVDKETTKGWYTEPVIVAFNVEGAQNTFYSLNQSPWEEYENPFEINQPGINVVEYRSVDSNNNYEKTKAKLIKIDSEDKWKKPSLKIKNIKFKVLQK